MKKGIITLLACTSFALTTAVGVVSFINSNDQVVKADDVSIDYDFDIYNFDVHNGQTYNIVGSYDSYYIYKNPTYFELLEYFSVDLPSGQEVNISINSFSYDGVSYSRLLLQRTAISNYRLRLLTNDWSSYLDLCSWSYDSTNNPEGYIYISNPSLWVSLFSGSNSYVVNSSYDLQLKFYKFFTYYYSNVSIRDFTLIMNDNPILDISSYLGEKLSNFGYFFYSSELYDLYNENSSWDLVTLFTIFQGGFYSNGVYYDRIQIDITSCYTPNQKNKYVFYYGTNTEYAYSDNASLKGYFFISAIRYINGNSGYRQEACRIRNSFSDGSGTLVDSFWVYYFDALSSYLWVNENYRTINLFYVSHMNINSSVLTSLNSILYSDFMNVYSDVIPAKSYNPVQPSTPTLFTQVFDFLSIAFVGLTPFLTWEILPGFSIGVLFLVPLVITLLLFVLKLFKR